MSDLPTRFVTGNSVDPMDLDEATAIEVLGRPVYEVLKKVKEEDDLNPIESVVTRVDRLRGIVTISRVMK